MSFPWPPDVKNWLIWKDPDAWNDWRRKEKGTTEDEMVGWHHQLNGHEFEEALGVGDGQGSLAYCSPWGHKVRHDWATEQHQWAYAVQTYSVQGSNELEICWKLDFRCSHYTQKKRYMKRQIYLISLTIVITSLSVYPIIMLNTLNIYNFYF